MLVNDRADAPELSTMRRFSHEWEYAAATVVSYRDRHGVTDPANPFGERAQAAADHARRLARARQADHGAGCCAWYVSLRQA
jgi:hypothetical protein